MRNGDSFRTFGAVVHTTEATLNQWCIKFKEFAMAKELGKVYEEQYWVNLLKKGAAGKMDIVRRTVATFDADGKLEKTQIIEEPGKFNATAVVFGLKNKFRKNWTDSQDLNVTTNDGLEALSAEEIQRRKDLYTSVLRDKNKNGR